ncbi:hypothetical protein AAVH_34886 [Aphelenchoides avenae]|nr:hypothetical protein AAVH_34886 [Aphelenchus avenae]
MFRELDLISKYWGFQMKAPSDFEETILRRGSLQAQRFLISLQMKRPECLRPAARELWSRVWLRDEPIHEIKHIKEVCEKLSIPGADEIIENASSQQVKAALKRNTDEALDSGAFGAPWIILKREGHPDLPFFGSDRLPVICDLLGCEYRGPLRNVDTHVKSRI